MEAADTLCDSLFRFLENRKECAEELEKLEQELEDVRLGRNVVKHVVRASKSAGFIAVCSTSTGVSFNKAIELMKEDEKVGTSIQEQLRDLKARCGETLKDECGGAPLGAHADELDCEVITRLMWALARRRKTPVPLDFLRGFNRATFFRHMTPGGLAPAEASDLICQSLGLDRSPDITSSLKVSAKEMLKNIELIGTKAAEAGSGTQGAAGFGISLCNLMVTTEELVKDQVVEVTKVTKATEFLQDSSREILEGQQKLKEQLDAMLEVIKKLVQIKILIDNLGGYSLSLTEEEQRIMNYIKGNCRDKEVLSWLQGLPHQIEFVNLLRFCQERLCHNLEDVSNLRGDHMDIVFLAHGGIVDRFMPAGALVPTPNIRDTILYSPWNCCIDSCAAFAIAHGSIQVADRMFFNIADCEPIPLPDRWNSMRESRHDIPEIHLYPMTPEDGAWEQFDQLWQNRRLKINDRVIIPYLVPEEEEKAYGEIPLYMFIFATSFILMRFSKTATVHLAACLGLKQRQGKWETQYAYTSDEMCMTVKIDESDINTELFRALKSLFDRNRRKIR